MSTIVWNKRLRKQKGKSRMDNLETLETPTSEKKIKHKQKTYKDEQQGPHETKKGVLA
jgi:hypothetical protein